MGENTHCLSGSKIPEANGRVEGAGDDLGVSLLADEVGDGLGVA